LGLASEARAQSTLDQRFPEGFALSPFEPAPAGDHFFIAPDGWSDPDAPEETSALRAMAFAHLTLKPTLKRTDNATGETREIVQRQLFVHADLTYYAAEWMLLNLDLPLAALQQGQGPVAPSTAVGDLRVGARVGIVGDRTAPFSFGPALDIWVPTGSGDNLTGDGALRANPKLVVSGKAGVFLYAANAGYLFRKRLNTGSLEIGPSFTFGGALGLSVIDDTLQIGPELQGQSLVSSEAGNGFSRTSPISTVLGARVQLGDFVLGAGVGPALTNAPGVASRVVASFAFSPRSRVEMSLDAKAIAESDRDSDGVPDRDDACPIEAGVKNADAKLNGCPERGASTVDSDGDGVPDGQDACPELLGTRSDDAAKNGCPSADRDQDGVSDTEDACPDAAGNKSADRKTNGCPPDSDGDGIADTVDACPNERGVATVDKATHGCAAKRAEKPLAQVKGKGDGKPLVTFIGYRKLSADVDQVYVEMTEAANVETTRTGRTVEFTIRNAKVTRKNNRNPLVASQFDSIVESARLIQAKKDVRLVIRLRAAAEPQSRVVARAGGATLEVDLSRKAGPLPPDDEPKRGKGKRKKK
jgi:hypothetical protein